MESSGSASDSGAMQRHTRRNWFSGMESITDADSDSDIESAEHAPVPWLKKLLTMVNFNFLMMKGVTCSFFGESCQTEMNSHEDPEHEDPEHIGHDHFGLYNIDGSICVRTEYMTKLRVDVAGIQVVHHSDHDHIYLHNTYGYGLESSGRICVQCKTRLLFVEEQTRFCCLDCKYVILHGEIKPSKQSSPLLPAASVPASASDAEPKSDYPSYKDIATKDLRDNV